MEQTEPKVDKRTKEYKESVQVEVLDSVKEPYAKIENNPGFKLCMICGCDLPPNEDGSPKWRKFPEPCDECKGRNR